MKTDSPSFTQEERETIIQDLKTETELESIADAVMTES